MINGIDPKVSAWLNIIGAIAAALVATSAQLTTIFGSGTGQTVATVAGIAVTVIGALNGALHGVSSSASGPLVKS